MKRKSLRNIVLDAIQDVNSDALTIDEEDEVADLVANRLVEEGVVDDEEEETEAEDE